MQEEGFSKTVPDDHQSSMIAGVKSRVGAGGRGCCRGGDRSRAQHTTPVGLAIVLLCTGAAPADNGGFEPFDELWKSEALDTFSMKYLLGIFEPKIEEKPDGEGRGHELDWSVRCRCLLYLIGGGRSIRDILVQRRPGCQDQVLGG